jgi:hypothetical protein
MKMANPEGGTAITDETEPVGGAVGPVLEKVPSGIRGLDEITFGGLPKGRPILVSGGPGCGKTLFAMEFVVRGILDYGEPGVFVTFEEKVEDLEKNFASLGFAALWTRWFLPDFDDSAWDTVHCLRGPLLYSDAGSRLFRTAIPAGATALELPLPVEKEHVLYVNGRQIFMVNGYNAQQPGWLELKMTEPRL